MTKIEWTDITWNPIVGCSRISPECDNCYAAAAAAAARLQRFPQYQVASKWDGTMYFVENALTKPKTWCNPRRIFICSMADLFHENVKEKWLDLIFKEIVNVNHHTYQILTKRPERMRDFIKSRFGKQSVKHIWLGITAGCQASVNDRLPVLYELHKLGWITFVSAEPLLEELYMGFGALMNYRVSQVIAGAELGKGARPMQENWVRSLKDQCVKANIPFFYKQNFVNGKKVSLPLLDGQQWTQFPK